MILYNFLYIVKECAVRAQVLRKKRERYWLITFVIQQDKMSGNPVHRSVSDFPPRLLRRTVNITLYKIVILPGAWTCVQVKPFSEASAEHVRVTVKRVCEKSNTWMGMANEVGVYNPHSAGSFFHFWRLKQKNLGRGFEKGRSVWNWWTALKCILRL
jgi:hypothetical protein